jgi:hypothetical protein
MAEGFLKGRTDLNHAPTFRNRPLLPGRINLKTILASVPAATAGAGRLSICSSLS